MFYKCIRNLNQTIPQRTLSTMNRPPPIFNLGIKLIVCDMAGTTIKENGIVYKILRNAMNHHGMNISHKEIQPWHGASKNEVLYHFCQKYSNIIEQEQINKTFEDMIQKEYNKKNSISLIPNLSDWIHKCQFIGIKVALNTGYSSTIQKDILKKLELDTMVDHWISSSDVTNGRPYPYMIYHIMEQANILNISNVAKVGDTVNDIYEGRNAGCGLVIGVLSGADSLSDLYQAGADFVIPDITHLKPY